MTHSRALLLASAAALAVVSIVSSPGCSTLEMSTDYNPSTDFTGYRTFDFKEGAKPKNQVAHRSVEYAVQSALEGRGLRNVDSGADLDIYIHFVLDTKMQFDTYGYGTVGWYGYGWGGTAVTTARVIPVGTVLVDLVDARTHNLVWRGIVKDEISTTLYPEEREKKAIRIAKDLFASFPPAKKG